MDSYMMSFYIGISIIFTILGLFWISLCVRKGLHWPMDAPQVCGMIASVESIKVCTDVWSIGTMIFQGHPVSILDLNPCEISVNGFKNFSKIGRLLFVSCWKTIESFGARSFMPSVKFLTGLTGISGVFGNEEVITKTEVEKSVENEDHNFIKPDAQSQPKWDDFRDFR